MHSSCWEQKKLIEVKKTGNSLMDGVKGFLDFFEEE